MKRTLEQRLRETRGPNMPADVETRVRQRIEAESAKPRSRRAERKFMGASPGQIALLFALVLIAGWVVRGRILPTLQNLWERTNCLVDPKSSKR